MGRFPPATLGLLVAFLVAFLAYEFADRSGQISAMIAFAVIPLRYGANAGGDGFTHWWEALGPIFGHPFLHAGWLHLGVNSLAFLQGGVPTERQMGTARYLILFAVSAIGSAALYILLNPQSLTPAVGASGAICGVFAGYFLGSRWSWLDALRDRQVLTGLAVFLAFNVGLAAAARMTGVLPIAWEAHLGGFIAGAIAYPFLAPRRPAIAPGPWG